ncbi:MAG: heme-binding domain-containing protein [Verrucomicrobiae bacterium]|nr:heme-binding domain-containing protein [Verrucomicrobiae bacterium]
MSPCPSSSRTFRTPGFRPVAAVLAACLPALTFTAIAAAFTATDRQPTPEELRDLPAVASAEKAEALLKEVQFPDDFNVRIFATPPAVNYPVFVAAAPDGTLYVSSDGNGSLDRKPHMGRVLRVRDTDGDGQADEVRAFVPDVDSPRGLVWDQDRLYLLHPPDISVFFDRDGDGVAEERRTLVSGIAFTFKDRPADHSSNGLALGADGWLYAAIGDFGFLEATGTDGRKLQLRGGGVVRLRPDGSRLELFAEGTRNILEVAVSPRLDGFARDNTNDGGGWDVRLHHFSGLTQHGYPRLFKNFPDEIIPPLADYGGGSGCGAAWIDEPGIPARWNDAPFTADWGTEWIHHHGLSEQGATFSATQERFAKLPRVTDLDVDANSAIYAASWKGASFTWVGPEVGFLVRATPKGFQPEPLPDFARASVDELATLLESPSHRRRLAAQRALLHRLETAPAPGILNRLGALAMSEDRPLDTRVAALFTVALAFPSDCAGLLSGWLRDPLLAPWIVRALGDLPGKPADATLRTLALTATFPDPRTRKESAVALARLGTMDDAPALVPLLRDADPVVAHTAVEALVRLRAVEACLAVVDDAETPDAARSGALRALGRLANGVTVKALIERLGREKIPERRAGLITTLCRLHFVEGPWRGDSWGTRPDTRGPFYQPEPWQESPEVLRTLKQTLATADATEAAWIGRELARHRIPAGDALNVLLARAAADPSLLPAIASQLAEAEATPVEAVPLLVRAATEVGTSDAARAQAVIALTRNSHPDAWRAVLRGLPLVQRTRTENNLAEKARDAVANASGLDQVHEVLESEAARLDGDSSLIAEGLLLRVASGKSASPETRAAANRALDAGWVVPARRVQILKAASQVRDSARAAEFVAALTDADPAVAAAAADTIKRLKIDPEKFAAEARSPKVGDLDTGVVLEAVLNTRGDAAGGELLFSQAGCNGCHTVRTGEPLKGPYLGTIAKTYRRRELAEAILIPNKTLAQGFITHHFELKDGSEVDGFVVQEAADAVTIRTVTAQEQRIPLDSISRREKQERSLMPEGLAAGWTVHQFASLLDYLEALSVAQ